MAEPALFPEPEHARPKTDGPWLVAPAPGCWRYLSLGEDGQWLLIDGHGIRDAEVLDVIRAAGVYADVDEAEASWWSDSTRRVWARQFDMCPRHLAHVEDCEYCLIFRADEGPAFEWTPRGEPADADRGKPGHFPVTVIDLEG